MRKSLLGTAWRTCHCAGEFYRDRSELPLPAGFVFDWLYPNHFQTLRCCLEAWADDPEVATVTLKFVAEFVMNKTQRLTFDSSSPNGILLFREVSKVPCFDPLVSPFLDQTRTLPILKACMAVACHRVLSNHVMFRMQRSRSYCASESAEVLTSMRSLKAMTC